MDEEIARRMTTLDIQNRFYRAVNKKDRPGVYVLTLDQRLRNVGKTQKPKNFKEAARFVKKYEKCWNKVIELLSKGSLSTYEMWLKLSDFKEVRVALIDDLFLSGVISLVVPRMFENKKKYSYYITRKIHPDLVPLIVPYKKIRSEKNWKKRMELVDGLIQVN